MATVKDHLENPEVSTSRMLTARYLSSQGRFGQTLPITEDFHNIAIIKCAL